MNGKQKLLLVQIYIHLLFLIGLFSIPLYITIPAIIFLHIFSVSFMITVFFHRTVAHRHTINPIAEKVLLFISWMMGVGSAIAVAGTHRKHHRFSDTEKDPHSPKNLGVFRTYWYGSGSEDIVRYVPDLLRKPLYVFQQKHYFSGLLLIHLLCFAIFPFYVYWVLLIASSFLVWFNGGLINICCHDNQGPINSNFFGFWLAGEGWHKNHHSSPGDKNFHTTYDWGGLVHKLVSYGNQSK